MSQPWTLSLSLIIIISIATLINGPDNERYPPPVLLLSAIICCRSPVQGWLHTGPRPCIQPSPSPDTDLLHTITCHQTHTVQYRWRDVMSASSKLGNTRNISESETFPIERKSPQSRLLASVIRVLHHTVLCCGTIVTICMFRFVTPHCRCR